MLPCWSLLHQRLERLLVVERISRGLQRVWESKPWENNWVKGKGAAGGREPKAYGREAGKKLQAESFQQNLLNNPFGREETFSQTFLVEYVEQQFSVPTFCGSVRKSWRESPNCWRCPVFAWTRKLSNYLTWWKLQRVWILNGSELLRSLETVFFGIEAQVCQRTWLRYIRE